AASFAAFSSWAWPLWSPRLWTAWLLRAPAWRPWEQALRPALRTPREPASPQRVWLDLLPREPALQELRVAWPRFRRPARSGRTPGRPRTSRQQLQPTLRTFQNAFS